MSFNSIETRQKDEFNSLRAIYGSDLKDLRKKAAWNNWTPLDFTVTLKPQKGSGVNQVYVYVDLHVICSNEYPNKVPKVLLENEKGISRTALIDLKEELDKKCHKRVGQEMIYELCLHIEEFLFKHNKPSMISLHHEMILSKEQKKMEKEFLKQMEKDKKKEDLLNEVKQRNEMLASEAKLRRERQKSTSDNEENVNRRLSVTNRKHQISFSEIEESQCDEHKGIVFIEFDNRRIQRGQCLRHDPYNTTFTGVDSQSGELIEICRWELNIGKHDQIQKNLNSLEQEVNHLMKLKHTNLTNYLGIKSEIGENKIVVYVLKEFIHGSSCYALFSSQNLKVDIDYLKYLAKGVLTAIDYLHRNNSTHKNLRDTCVIVNQKGVVKVSDYSIYRRLLDLVSSDQRNYNYYSKKTDILDFGKLVLTLLRHLDGSENNVEIPACLQSDLYEFLTKCLAEEENERSTANQLLNHSFFLQSVEFCTLNVPKEIPLERNSSPEITHNVQNLWNGGGSSQSRIYNEFEILDNLGEGAYGVVLKARNKLDRGYYAIKRIKLNPKNKTLNKKTVKEVKLLSRLNHENVVRYYNAWIETNLIRAENEADTSMSTDTTQTAGTYERDLKNPKKDELTIYDDIERLAPPMKKVEISVTFDSEVTLNESSEDESSEDDSSDEDEGLVAKYKKDSDSDSIQFENESAPKSISKNLSKTNASSNDTTEEDNTIKKIDFLYIQMEFCEKSTLRTAIDSNLYKDQNRVWRLFREIVEGLVHIHQQDMIHRDLKPVNIFLDSSDHVKIGDFGLATTIAIRTKQTDVMGVSKSPAESSKEEMVDDSKTGHVGTALYVAPETVSAVKAHYNQKVDIYSLGIILFEMCHAPLATEMERRMILSNLRQKEIIFPSEFAEKNQNAHCLIKWLLNHEVSKRPTSQELLQCEKLPPPVLEERKMQELVRHTLNNPQLKSYKYLISSCFKQVLTPAQDITYDRDPTMPITSKPLDLYEYVRETCVKIFKLHGGQHLSTPLLMPKSKYYEDVKSCVKLMTHFGNIVSLPHDLRVPFARYVAWNTIGTFRRYTVERVYREKKVFGFLPREFYECAFDIVSSNQGSLIADAEILYIVYEIINKLPGAKSKNFQIKLNHTSLIKAIFLHCGLKDRHEELLRLLDMKEEKVTKSQIYYFLINRGLSDNMINMLLNFLQGEFDISKTVSNFQMMTKKKSGETSRLANLALDELETIIRNAESYGVTFDFVIAPGLVYNIQHYSGMVCQFVCELTTKRKRDTKGVVAVGGRYDEMISYYRSIMEQANMISKDNQQSAVGISILLDNLVQAMQKQKNDDIPKIEALDVLVCSVGTEPKIKEKTRILTSLWTAGIKCALIETVTLVEMHEKLIEQGVSHAIIINDQGNVRVKSWDINSRESCDRFQEKSVSSSEIVEYMQKILKNRNVSITESMTGSNITLSRSESKTSNSDRIESEHMVDIRFVINEKLPSSTRKRYDTQVKSQLDSLFKKLSGSITVIAVNVESNVVKTLSSFLDYDSEEKTFRNSVDNCIEMHPRCNDKDMREICHEIREVRLSKSNPTVVLYSLPKKFYRVII